MRHLTMQDMRGCIDDCSECATICQETLTFCLTLAGAHAEPEHCRLLADTAEICQLAASAMIRRSDFRADICKLAAVVAKACADSCRHLDTAETLLCAETCEQCADACETMAVSIAWSYQTRSGIRPEHGSLSVD